MSVSQRLNILVQFNISTENEDFMQLMNGKLSDVETSTSIDVISNRKSATEWTVQLCKMN